MSIKAPLLQTITVVCKVSALDEPTEQALKETTVQFANACNYALDLSEKEKIRNKIALQKRCYFEIRKNFGLSSNLAIQAIRRVSGAYAKRKKKKKPKKFRETSVCYDQRTFSYCKETISLSTTRGRFRKIPLCLGKYQRKKLEVLKPETATLICKKGTWYLHIQLRRKQRQTEGKGFLGVDCGIRNSVALSNREDSKIEGATRQKSKEKFRKVRASLQSKGTRGAKKILKKTSGKERRRTRHENHVLAKMIVEEAIRHKAEDIRMEQLEGIRKQTKTWNKHTNRMVASWSFYQLGQYIEYKATYLGLAFERVNPAYTSQTCSTCGKLGNREGEAFTCTTCGKKDADYNAACVIASGGGVRKPPRISGTRC